jgi:serine/threonine protein kinase
LVKEATIMKKFNQPSVLPLYAAFVAGRELWFVTPYMGAGSVRSIMKQQFPLVSH